MCLWRADEFIWLRSIMSTSSRNSHGVGAQCLKPMHPHHDNKVEVGGYRGGLETRKIHDIKKNRTFENNIKNAWKPIEITWKTNKIIWKPHKTHMKTIQKSHGNHVQITWEPNKITWKPYRIIQNQIISYKTYKTK